MASAAPPPNNRRSLVVIWLLFFFQYAGIGLFFNFIYVYYNQAGLSGTEIGIINMVVALVSMVSATVWGYLNDRTGQTRLILALGAFFAAFFAQFISLAETFLSFLLFASLYGAFNAAPSTLVDSLALTVLGERREEYGRYRLGGSFGYILATSTSGIFYEQVGLWAIFPAFALSSLAFILSALWLPNRQAQVQLQSHHSGSILEMARQPAWFLFIGTVFFIWFAANSAFGYLNITIKSMGGSNALVGFGGTIAALVELPFMAFSGQLIRRFGAARLFWISTLGYVVRFIGYSQMRSPEWVLLINGFAGPVYVLFWNSAVNITNRLAPPKLASTAQGLLVSTTSLAGVLSAPISGVLYDQIGFSGLFQVMACAALVAFFIFSLRQLLFIKKATAG